MCNRAGLRGLEPTHDPKAVGSNPAPATIDDERLADAGAADPLALPRLHPGIGFAGLATQGPLMALREHIDRALRVGATRLDGDRTRSLADTAHGAAARFDFATTPPYRQRVRSVSWGPTGAEATTGAHEGPLAGEVVVRAL